MRIINLIVTNRTTYTFWTLNLKLISNKNINNKNNKN